MIRIFRAVHCVQKIVAGIILALLANQSYGDEAVVPKFESAPEVFASPTSVIDRDGEKHWLIDQALIGNKTPNSLTFWLYLYGANFHICSISGEAKQTAPSEFEFRKGDCRLKLTLNGRRLSIEDNDNSCKKHNCGYRASFNGATLFRASE